MKKTTIVILIIGIIFMLFLLGVFAVVHRFIWSDTTNEIGQINKTENENTNKEELQEAKGTIKVKYVFVPRTKLSNYKIYRQNCYIYRSMPKMQ